ncbi:hypothetical protein HDV00_007129 [Rhizophlyctis rosea]|nr:hypothetical protein HDV00_007129 [Rhizophlyctis rosea]
MRITQALPALLAAPLALAAPHVEQRSLTSQSCHHEWLLKRAEYSDDGKYKCTPGGHHCTGAPASGASTTGKKKKVVVIVTVTHHSSHTTAKSGTGYTTKKVSTTKAHTAYTTHKPTTTKAPAPKPHTTTKSSSGSYSNPYPKSSSDRYAIGNSQFPVQCSWYINQVSTLASQGKKVVIPQNNPRVSFAQYDCSRKNGPRCSTPDDGGQWDGDSTWVWNTATDSNSDPYRYNTIWFMQLIGDSDDLFHECDDNPRSFSLSQIASTPLNMKVNCITLGKWCRAWTGHVKQNKKINIQGKSYSVENAFLYLSKNRMKIDFKDETIWQSQLRQIPLDEQKKIAAQWKANEGNGSGGNCITDQHYCKECNGDSNHCAIAQGCLNYVFDGEGFCP